MVSYTLPEEAKADLLLISNLQGRDSQILWQIYSLALVIDRSIDFSQKRDSLLQGAA